MPALAALLTKVILVLAVGLAASWAARRSAVPDLVFFLLLGVLLGPSGLHWTGSAAPSALTTSAVLLGALFMVFEGGRELDARLVPQIWLGVVLLATLGVGITAAGMAVALHLLLHLPWWPALLGGSIVAATDPATIVPLLEEIHVVERLRQLVVAESALNDATGAALTVTLLSLGTPARASLAGFLLTFARQALLGLAAGLAVGLVFAWIAGRVSSRSLVRRSPEGVLLGVVLPLGVAYLLAGWLGGSGFVAAFAAGFLLRNSRHLLGIVPLNPGPLETLRFLVRFGIFTWLGTTVPIRLLLPLAIPGLIALLLFLLVVRPLTVFLCLRLDPLGRWRREELLFAAWVRETGIVPAALALALLGVHVAKASVVAAVVFWLVLGSILLQGLTTRPWARRLGILRPAFEEAGEPP